MATRRKEDRCKRAQERQEVQVNRTPQEQLKRLDEKFGEGKGAVKERARLKRMLVKVVSSSELGELPKPA